MLWYCGSILSFHLLITLGKSTSTEQCTCYLIIPEKREWNHCERLRWGLSSQAVRVQTQTSLSTVV